MRYKFDLIKKQLESYNFKYLEYFYNEGETHGLLQLSLEPYLIIISIESDANPYITIYDNYISGDISPINTINTFYMEDVIHNETNEESFRRFEKEFLIMFQENFKEFIRKQKIKNVLED